MWGWWTWIRARRTSLLDGLLWAVLALPIGYARITPPYESHAGVLLIASLLLLAVAVRLSRRAPLAALVLVVGGTLFDGNFVFGVPVLSCLIGWRGTRTGPATLVFVAIGLAGTVVNLALLGTVAEDWFLAATTLVFAGVLPWLIGRHLRQRRELILAGWEQAETLTREQRGVAERVRLRERARIAQDMHDSLGHELSLIALRAGALELAPDLDPRHRAAAGELRASVTAATERLRTVIGVLREEPAPVRPAGETLTELVERAGEAGMVVRLLTDGTERELPPLTAAAVHRVVQEGLTNAARHAPGAPVTVTLRRRDGWAGLSVVNGPAPVGPVPTGSAPAGTGLLALGERVRLVGGTFDAAARNDGFEVRARLPLTGGVPVQSDGLVEAGVPADVGARVEVGTSVDVGAPVEVDGSVTAQRLRQVHRRRVRRSLLVAVTAPALAVGALSLVYYPFVTVNAVLDPAAYDRMRPGQARTELTGLPRRQAGDPGGGRGAPPGTHCEHYTDGNFPLARPTYRLCFADGRLVGKERLDG